MAYLLLLFLIASCTGFKNEENFVDIVVALKHFFYSGCVYALHDEELGKCKRRKNPFYSCASDDHSWNSGNLFKV
jgi:hypothetical protein